MSGSVVNTGLVGSAGILSGEPLGEVCPNAYALSAQLFLE